MLEEQLATNIVEFSVTESAISELKEKYMPLVINGIEDKDGYKIVSAARKVIKSHRVDIEHRRKELTASALEYQRKIMAEAKRVTALLEPIESHLESQEKAIDAEIKAIKDEKERIEREKQLEIERAYQSRLSKLKELSFWYNGINFILENKYDNSEFVILSDRLKQDDENEFLKTYGLAKKFSDSIKLLEAEEKAAVARMQQENERMKKELAEAQELAKRDTIERQKLIDELEKKEFEERLQSAREENTVVVITDDFFPDNERMVINSVQIEKPMDMTTKYKKLLEFVIYAAELSEAGQMAASLPIDARELLNEIGETYGAAN